MQRRSLLGLLGLLLVLVSTLLYVNGVSATTAAATLSARVDHAPSAALRNPRSPIKLTGVYRRPRDTSGNLLSVQQVGRTFDYIIHHASWENHIRDYRKPIAEGGGGWQGQAMLYVLLNGMQGPATLRSEDAQQDVCITRQNEFRPGGNNVMWDDRIQDTTTANNFCVLHDTIVANRGKNCSATPSPCTGFDMDLDGDLEAVYPTENWFLHERDFTAAQSGTPLTVEVSVGEDPIGQGNARCPASPNGRIFESTTADPENDPECDDAGASHYFRPHPGREDVRKLYETRIGRLLTNYPAFDGLFLDNVEWETSKLERNSGGTDKLPIEYSTEGEFVGHVQGLVDRVRASAKRNNAQLPVWANMINNYQTSNGWSPYNTRLEGGMLEFFALRSEDGCPRPPAEVEAQMEQAWTWLTKRASPSTHPRHFLAVANAESNLWCPSESESIPSEVFFLQRGRFAFGALLMVTDGENTSFELNDHRKGVPDVTAYYYHLGETDLNFGRPVGARAKVTGTTDVVYQRQFENCMVRVNLTRATADFSDCSSQLYLPMIVQDRSPGEPRIPATATLVPPSTPSLSGYPQPPSAYPAPATATPSATTTPYVVGRVYNPRGTPIVARMCRADGYSTPTLCQTTSNPALFAVPPSGSQRGIWTVAGVNEVVVGVTPLSSGGTSVMTSSTGQHVWPRWSTGSRTVRFVMATVTRMPSHTPTVTRTPSRTPTRTPTPAPPTATPRWSPTPVTCTDLGCPPTPTPGVSMQGNVETPVPIELVP